MESGQVRRCTEFLQKAIGKTITKWIFTDGKYIDKFPSGYSQFYKTVPLLVENINCKGNFVYFTLLQEKTGIH